MTEAEAFVLDASVTAAWLLPDEHTEGARKLYARLRGGTIDVHAPELWLAECGNVIASAVKRKRVAKADAIVLWAVLDLIRSRVECHALVTTQWRAVLMLAVDEALSIYDASYLWLAMSLNLPLFTQDAALARRRGARASQC